MQAECRCDWFLLCRTLNLSSAAANNLPRKVLHPSKPLPLRRLKSIHIETKSH